MKKVLMRTVKIVGILAAVMAVSLGALGSYYYIHEELPKKKVEVTVRYASDDTCSKEYPMFVIIKNESNRVINVTSFDISVRREGYSSNLTASTNAHYWTDKIMRPKTGFTACYSYPELRHEYLGKYNPTELVYEMQNKSIFFSN